MSQWSREEVVWEDFEVCGGAAAADSRFANNRIMTSKYTSLGMLPKFVFQQFMDIRMQFFMFANIASVFNWSVPVHGLSSIWDCVFCFRRPC
ncbi:MAG: hypothetical protein MHMPM18_003601 [Marteilia pararefringens]